ncbi:DUF1573 domain-containing protein [Stieleria sp. TO1_6]|nr:DUF1573 domain-containing protein [Stieleria tagensis]
MHVFLRSVIRAAVCIVVALASDEATGMEQKTVTLKTDLEVEQLSVFGKIQVYGGSTNHDINLKTDFIGNIYQGRVLIENNGKQTVLLDKLTSSCGCTLAQPSSPEILPGETQNLLIQVAKKSIGVFKEKIDIQLAGRVHQLRISGELLPQISSSDEVVFAKNGSSEIDLQLHDDRIKPEQLSFAIAGEIASVESSRYLGHGDPCIRLTLKRVDVARFTDRIVVVPQLKTESGAFDLVPITLNTRFVGMVRVVPSTVFVRPGIPVRIFLFGDVEAIVSESKTHEGFARLSAVRLEKDSAVDEGKDARVLVDPIKNGVALTVDGDPNKLFDSDGIISATCAGVDLRFRVRILRKEEEE